MGLQESDVTEWLNNKARRVLSVLLSWSLIIWSLFPVSTPATITEVLYTSFCLLFGRYVLLFATPWTVAHQAPLSMGFFRHKYWSGLPFSPAGDLQRLRNWTHASWIAEGFFTPELSGRPYQYLIPYTKINWKWFIDLMAQPKIIKLLEEERKKPEQL